MSRAWQVDNLDPAGTVDANARRILAVRVAEFYSHVPALDDPDAVETLHAMRIGAKRLRYTLELFEDLFGSRSEQQIKRVKQLQEELGHIHDLDVRIELIKEELSSISENQLHELENALKNTESDQHRAVIASALRPPPDDPRRGLLALLGRQYEERREHRDTLIRFWEQYATEGMRVDLVKLSTLTPS
jgi:hypothetical protein